MKKSKKYQFPPLLGMGLMLYTAGKQIKEKKMDESLGGHLSVLSFRELIFLQIDLTSLYYGLTTQYKIPQPLKELKSIIWDMMEFRKNDGKAFEIYNKGVQLQHFKLIGEAMVLAPHNRFIMKECSKIVVRTGIGSMQDKHNAKLILKAMQDEEQYERNRFPYIQKEYFDMEKKWYKGKQLDYFDIKDDLFDHIISFVTSVSNYFEGKKVNLNKKELIKGLEEIQVIFEWISLLASMTYSFLYYGLKDEVLKSRVTKNIVGVLGFTPEYLDNIQTPNFVSPAMRKQKWVEIMGMDILSFRAMTSIKQARYMHADGDIGNDDPKTHGWLSRKTDKMFKAEKKHDDQVISTSEEILKHFEIHFSNVDKILHDTKQDKYHIDTYIFPPTNERNYGIMVTSGMSQYPMNVPLGDSIGRHAELFMQFPPDWPLPLEELKQDKYSWAFRHLYEFSRFVHQRNTFFWHGQVIDLHQPLGKNTKMTGYIIAHPIGLPKGFGTLESKSGKIINFLQLIPAYKEEMDFLEVKGWDALDSKFKANKVTGIFDLKRANTCISSAKKPLINSKELIKKCPQCGKSVKKLWTACYHCLNNLDGNDLYLNEKDLAEYCEILCELEFTYDDPENQGYFDFFMLFKNLFDAISFFVYNDGPITSIAEFYMFISPFFQSKNEMINSERLKMRMDAILKSVWRPLKEQDVFNSIDGVKAMTTLPQVVEKDKREQHLKSRLWHLGTTINITLRGDLSKNHPLLRGMFDLLALLRRGAYGSKGVDALKAPFKEFKKEWKNITKPHEKVNDSWISPLMENMKTTLKGVSEILEE